MLLPLANNSIFNYDATVPIFVTYIAEDEKMNFRKSLVCLLGSLLFTSTSPAESIRFAVVSDTQGPTTNEAVNPRVFPKIVENVLKADPAVQFVIVTGDLTSGTDDNEQQLQEFLPWRQLAKPWYDSDMIGVKVYALPGNHDLRDSQAYAQIWQTAFPELPDNGPDTEQKLTYSFDVGPCHFVALKTVAPNEGYKVNLNWLAKDLAASSAPLKLVFGHAPAYPALLHIGTSLDSDPEMRNQFWDILANNHVKAYFCGHEHMSDHWIYKNVHQITLGGGGGFSLFFHYLIVDADENDVTVSVYCYTGEFHHQYKLSDTASVNNEDRTDPNRSVANAIPCLSTFAAIFPLCFMGLTLLTKNRLD